MGKIFDEIEKLATKAGDNALREKQIKNIFCMTEGMQIWQQFQVLNKVTSPEPEKYEYKPFPLPAHPDCPCEHCVKHRQGGL